MHFYPISGFRCKDRKIILNTQQALTIFSLYGNVFSLIYHSHGYVVNNTSCLFPAPQDAAVKAFTWL